MSNLIIRWLAYLLFITSTTKGAHYIPSSDDTPKQHANFYYSSPNIHNNVDQLYSNWSQWSTCSGTCGTGIATRTRKCLKNSYNSRGVSIPLCHGELTEHKICTLKVCPPDIASVRELQCKQYNNRIIAGKYVKDWMPTNEGSNPCELRCEAKSEQLVYSFGKVSNGTPCPLGICLDGRCLVIGCDDRLGSSVTFDMCGVCGGGNSTCVHYKDVFQDQPSSSNGSRSVYHEVVSIPVDARHLIIHQSISKNLLALQDRSKGIIFSGEQSANKYGGHYEIAGSPVEYLKSSNSTEELIIKGPLMQELYVLVLLRSPNPGIFYEYWLPRQSYGHKIQYPVQSIPRATSTINKPTDAPLKSQFYTTPAFSTKPVIHREKHRPTKPAFAYGYGEKPYKGQEFPIFRHILSTTTTTSKPAYSWYKSSIKYPSQSDQYNKEFGKKDFGLRKDVYSGYKPRYLKPETDYYQTFRNVSKAIVKPLLDYTKELPVQGDSSVSNDRHENFLSSSGYNKKEEVFGFKEDKADIKISKRGDVSPRKFISNGRLKYSFDVKPTEEVHVNKSGTSIAEHLSINVLTLPEDGKSKPNAKSKGRCDPCPRIKNQLKHFCESDFVLRAQVVNYEFLNGETRYELDVIQSYKNNFALLPKEYIWSPDTCRCPKLRQGKEYVLMGKSDSAYKKRESRLLVDKTSFVRTFNLKYARRLQKLRKDETKKCKKES